MRRRPLLAAVALTVLLAACGGGDEPAPSPSPSPARSPRAPAATTPRPGPTAPLTGLPATPPVPADRPAVAVKVGNSPAARPQSGLDDADIVFEELVEGGATRFIAIFHSRVPDRVGPIRSGRLVDAQVLPAFRPLVALSGARDQVVGALRSAGLATVYEDGRVLTRDRSRRAPYNVYATGADLVAAAEEADRARPPAPAFRYAEEPPRGAVACPSPPGPTGPRPTVPPDAAPSPTASPACAVAGLTLRVPMSRASVTGWEYDRPAGVYRRLQNGVPFEVTGGGAIGAANVVVLGLEIRPGACCDTAGNRLVVSEVLGSGPAIVLRDGLRYDATWSKDAPERHFRLAGPAGRELRLRPGPTWVLLAPRAALPAAP